MRKKEEDLMRTEIVDVTMDSGCFKKEDKEHRDQKKMWSRGHCGKGEKSKIEVVWTCGKKR